MSEREGMRAAISEAKPKRKEIVNKGKKTRIIVEIVYAWKGASDFQTDEHMHKYIYLNSHVIMASAFAFRF